MVCGQRCEGAAPHTDPVQCERSVRARTCSPPLTKPDWWVPESLGRAAKSRRALSTVTAFSSAQRPGGWLAWWSPVAARAGSTGHLRTPAAAPAVGGHHGLRAAFASLVGGDDHGAGRGRMWSGTARPWPQGVGREWPAPRWPPRLATSARTWPPWPPRESRVRARVATRALTATTWPHAGRARHGVLA